MRIGVFALALAATLACPAAPGLANVFAADGVDPRIIQPRTGPGAALAMIGLITTAGEVPLETSTGETVLSGGQGTAFLVSPCHVLTNHHVAFGETEKPDATILSIYHALGADGISTREVLATPVVWGPRHATGRITDDWALLQLEECIGRRTGWMEFALLAPQQALAQTVAEAGFSGDKDHRFLWLHDSCRLYRPDRFGYDGVYFHDCASTGGNSGSPVFIVGEGAPRVVALDQGEFRPTEEVLRTYTSDRANLAVDIRIVHAEIASIIEADRAGLPNPAAKPVTQATLPVPALTVALQEALLRHGCYTGAVDGIWGPRSAAGAVEFSRLTDQGPVAGTPAGRPAAWQAALHVLDLLPAPVCVARQTVPITVGAEVEGALEPADFIDAYGTYADCYVLTLAAGTRLRIDVMSKAFDTFLEFGRDDGRLCGKAELTEANDDGGEGTNSRLSVLAAAPGRYIIRVTSFSVGEVGPYTLTVVEGR